MTKTFHEILAEKDDEHVYYIHSTADIHNPALFEKIKISLLPYEIKSIECESYKPLSKSNTLFPDEPNSPTYTIKVTTRYPVTKGFLSILAMDAHIHVSHLKIDPDTVVDPVNYPEEISKEESQKTVGTKRIAEFIKELQQDRKERQDMSWEREVYESFYTTHRSLERVLHKPLRKGYYMVEAYTEGGKKYFQAQGPFPSRPEENPYHDRIQAVNPQIVSESTENGQWAIQVLVEDLKAK